MKQLRKHQHKRNRLKQIKSSYSRISNAVKQKRFTLFALPESKRKLIKELRFAQLLGNTNDNKEIYLLSKNKCPAIMREIGRLREISFRAMGEGTGKARDIDSYDNYYQQIILWNPNKSEIVGGYRIGSGQDIIVQNHSSQNISPQVRAKKLYISSLFDLQPNMVEKLQQGIELGRSFIQPRYWGKRNLDHLWMGIGAYLYTNPQVRYLFGPVSLPDHLPESAKSLITHYYATYYGSNESLATAKNPYLNSLPNPFNGLNAELELRELRQQLKQYDVAIPTLYKHYTDLCKSSGTQVIDYNIDPDFNNCIDALMMVDLSMIKPKKAARYIDRHQPIKEAI